jgi:cytochrome c-type biogenesis protein CcmE
MLTEPAAPPTEAALARKRKRKVPISFIIAGLAVAGAVVYLVIANTSASAEYYMSIAQLRSCTTCATRAVRVAGTVANDTITRDTSQSVHFTINDGAHDMSVVYAGTLPDTFHADAQIVVEGHLANDVFQADQVLVKCPSKYQAPTPGVSS